MQIKFEEIARNNPEITRMTRQWFRVWLGTIYVWDHNQLYFFCFGD